MKSDLHGRNLYEFCHKIKNANVFNTFLYFHTFFFFILSLAEFQVYEARHYTVFSRIAKYVNTKASNKPE